ncbi:MAG: NUDIX domain-containing protein [Neisseriaceae bacterium]|nr:MAG: NUDIX domain-containing protein [Neisseriaceae bacterium]
MDLTERKISSDLIYESNFVKISRDKIQLPNGNNSYRIVINHPGAVCILATTKDNKVILVKQFRYAVGEALLEIPAGKLDVQGEDPAKCAMRELAEETPYTAKSVTLLQTFYSAPGFCDEKMYLYQAHDVQKNSQLKPDPDEILETILLSREEVKNSIAQMKIKDAKTLIALNYWLSEK